MKNIIKNFVKIKFEQEKKNLIKKLQAVIILKITYKLNSKFKNFSPNLTKKKNTILKKFINTSTLKKLLKIIISFNFYIYSANQIIKTLKKMKIIILFLAIVCCTLVSVKSEEMCRNLEVRVTSSLQPNAQTFTIDVKKLRFVKIEINDKEYRAQNLVPHEQAGLVLEKTPSSNTLDPIHHKYLRNEPTFAWLPYSYASDWSLNGFKISSQLKRTSESKTEYPLITFEFANDQEISNISAEDMDKLATNLRANTSRRHLIKTTLKANINKAQDAFVLKTKIFKETSEKNTNSATQLVELRRQLAVTITEITTLVTQEAALEKSLALEASALDQTNEQLNILNNKLKLLVDSLKLEESNLNAIRPTDLSALQKTLAINLTGVQYPQTKPAQFLDEFGIATEKKRTIVSENYTNCNQKAELLVKCQSFVTSSSSLAKKKLRRNFF